MDVLYQVPRPLVCTVALPVHQVLKLFPNSLKGQDLMNQACRPLQTAVGGGGGFEGFGCRFPLESGSLVWRMGG